MLTARLCDLHERKEVEPMDTDQPSYSVPANLSAILKVYGLNKPPAHITVRQVFEKIISKVGHTLHVLHPNNAHRHVCNGNYVCVHVSGLVVYKHVRPRPNCKLKTYNYAT